MALKSIAKFSANWQRAGDTGVIVLERADGAWYRVNIKDRGEFDTVINHLKRGPSIQLDTRTLDIRVHFQLVHQGKLRCVHQ